MPSEHIKNLNRLLKRLSDPDWIERPAGSFLHQWREDFRREAAAGAPYWMGDLKASIESLQDTAKFPLYARVFTDEPQGRWMEYGTGLLSEDPLSAHHAYFPPPAALEPWATDHGLNAWAVAAGIHARGGTEPRHFFRDAEQAADRSFNRYMAGFARGIEFYAAAAD